MEKVAGIYKKTSYIKELLQCNEGAQVFELFLVSKVSPCVNERGVRWLDVVLSDCTGKMHAKMWADNMRPEYEGYGGLVVSIKGRIGFYGGRPELIIELMQPLEKDLYMEEEICRCPTEEMLKFCERQIITTIKKIQDGRLQSFVNDILLEQRALNEMKELPVKIDGRHHAYRGGLIEHTSEVVTMAFYQSRSAEIYRNSPVDMDLVISGAIIHDIASIIQQPAGYGATIDDSLRLMGYRYMAHTILDDTRRRNWIPEDIYSRLLHITDSSHEAGPQPLTIEAMVVRSANLLSISMSQYDDACRGSQQGSFVYSRELRREVYRVGSHGGTEKK